MQPALSSEKPPVQPPLILKPITDEMASTAALVHHILRGLDKTQVNATLPTASLELILKSFVQLVEARNMERLRGPAR
jgi:hypothetical protein